MNSNWNKSFMLLLMSEGGYSAHEADPGGRTNLGVTQAVWENWVGRVSGEKEMRSLTPEMVKPLYKKKYWDACKCDELPLGIDYLVFEFACNAGVGRSIKSLQTVVGTTPDGTIGPKTLQAMMVCSKTDLIDKFSAAKEAFYRSLPTFAVFGKGWLNRIQEAKCRTLLLSASSTGIG
jgi:lysozyme family protein